MRAPHRPDNPTAEFVRLEIAEVRRRALLVAAAWWLAGAVSYLLVAYSADGPPPGCSGLGCLSDRGVLLGLGMLLALPAVLLVIPVSVAVVVVLSRSARSGLVLGTQVAAGGAGTLLTSAMAAVLTFG
ncbi:hypothetical protein [Actinoplanes sp. NPDC020271]|uniref:hypothetical protein n=1 Tax=Actinoplanes sp. NPDC020271 TaxID=3363896 RepID=UPI003792105D